MIDSNQDDRLSEKRHDRGSKVPVMIFGIVGLAILVIFTVMTLPKSKTTVASRKDIHRKGMTTGSLQGSVNGHDWVDLGLPSGLKWSTCNVGANTAEECGDYFGWGETTPKDVYSTTNSLTYKESFTTLKDNGIVDESGTLSPSHDAAHANWGHPWRMPDDDDFKELVECCTWTFLTSDDINGYLVTGPNKKSIFLVASAYRQDSTVYHEGEFGDYWSSTIVKELSGVSCSLGYSPKSYGRRRYDRYIGRTIRPVTE